MKLNTAIISAAILLSVQAMAEPIMLAPPFEGLNNIDFSYSDFPSGDRSISAILTATGSTENIRIENICEPEGGDATIGNVATTSKSISYGDILATTCIYKINHSGIGLNGTLYQTKIYQKTGKALKELTSLEELLSGYEGQLESGETSYYFYKDHEAFSEKLKLISENEKLDSIEIAQKIAIQTLRKDSAEAAGKYLSDELISHLTEKYPLTKNNVQTYNDIGYVLVEANKNKQALYILLPIEKISPQRLPLYLNIADAYWPSDKEKAREYYKKYKLLMIEKNKKNLIPERVEQRIKEKQ